MDSDGVLFVNSHSKVQSFQQEREGRGREGGGGERGGERGQERGKCTLLQNSHESRRTHECIQSHV